MQNYWEPDDKTIINPDGFYLTVELQKLAVKEIDIDLFPRYLDICSCTKLDSDEWMSKEDFIIMCICKGFGKEKEKLSKIVNRALLKGMLEVAKFQVECEKELKITEGE